jgi:hypothetical protein
MGHVLVLVFSVTSMVLNTIIGYHLVTAVVPHLFAVWIVGAIFAWAGVLLARFAVAST